MIKLKKIVEHIEEWADRAVVSPNKVLKYTQRDAYAFGYPDRNGEIAISKPGDTHNDINVFDYDDDYPRGRYWINDKVIAFWVFPKDKNEMQKLIKDINDKRKKEVINSSWKIEIPLQDSSIFNPLGTRDGNASRDSSMLLPINDFDSDIIKNPVKWRKNAKEKMQQHMMSPIAKKIDVVGGIGSKKRPAGLTQTQSHQIKRTSDGVIELKKIVESPDAVYDYLNNTEHNYEDNDAYPFFYYQGNILLSDTPGIAHYDIKNRNDVDREDSYDGRIWLDGKLLSFWKYPKNSSDMKKVADKLSDEFYDKFNMRIDIWRDFNIETEEDEENREVNDDYIIPVKYFAGSANQPEDEYQKHILSPAQKKDVDVTPGWGSKKTPAGLSATQRHQMKSASERTIKLKKLVESPDNIFMSDLEYSIDYDNDDAYPFYYIENKLYIADRPGKTHDEIRVNMATKRRFYDSNSTPYGRIWVDTGVMSFWQYPDDRTVMRNVADDISEHFHLVHNININVWEDFQVEVNHDGAFDTSRSGLIPVKSYKGSDSPPEEERLQHILSPAQKKDINVTPGWGSKKTPSGMSSTQRHQMKSTSERNIKLKNLVESPDSIDPANTMWYNGRSFGYQEDEMLVGDVGVIHNAMIGVPQDARYMMEYSGRIWPEEKIISFWEYPPTTTMMKKVISDIQDGMDYDGDIWNTFDIEIIVPKDIATNKNDTSVKFSNNSKLPKDYTTKIIRLKDYTTSENPDEKDKAASHMMSPIAKPQMNTDMGVGSKKRPAGLSATQRHQLQRTSDGIIKLSNLIKNEDSY